MLSNGIKRILSCKLNSSIDIRTVRHSHLPAKTVNNKNTEIRCFEEIKIEVPWGHLAGKWYGPKHIRPIVGLHGWQDNAGSFDTLAPLLPQHMSFLTLDMPGHGLSSWVPVGMAYHSIDYVALLLRLMDKFNWNKLSLMAHSMSAMNTFIFSALFPDKVDMLIALDILKPLTRSPKSIVDFYSERLEALLKAERRISQAETEPPTYTWEELEERLYLGTNKSINKECCKFILERNVRQSQADAQKYYFSRDSRLKSSLFFPFATNAVPLEMAHRIKCPHLYIKALQAPYFERKEYFDEMLPIMQQNPFFAHHEVDGTHHVHLNEPHKVSEIVNPFILKWRP